MEEIIKTTLLEHEKSTFLIDLLKTDKAQLYIKIQQTIHLKDDVASQEEIKINPSVLTEILEVLTAYKDVIPKQQFNRKHYLTEESKIEIQKRYLKGISIREIALQFSCSEALIEQLLYNKGIPIVSNKQPKEIKYRKFRRRKRQ